jgi:hypothetical protein
MSPNELESKTLHTIASALAPGAIKYIQQHEEYEEVMISLIKEFVENNFVDAQGELPFMIFDMCRMYLAKGRD